MRVVVSAEVFAVAAHGDGEGIGAGREGEARMGLVHLLDLARQGRHRVLVEDEAGFQRWCDGLGEALAAACAFALRASREAEARSPARHEIRIERRVTPDWTSPPPRMALDDALRLLSRPFQLLVEHVDHDTEFLLAVADEVQRAELRRRRSLGWWQSSHGGGDDMLKQIELLAQDPQSGCITWVLFDSDARLPAQPSDKARKKAAACAGRIPHHQTVRRAAENYAPRRALDAWTLRAPQQSTPSRVDAFFRLPASSRHHYNMKEGLRGDVDSSEGIAGGLYDHLAAAERGVLERGFGRKLREVFRESDLVRTIDLIDDGSFDELSGAVAVLLELMR